MASFSEHITKYGNFLLLLKSNFDNDSLKSKFYREIFIFTIFNTKGDSTYELVTRQYSRKDWFNRDIIYINDLMAGKEFLSYEAFCKKC